MKASIENHQTWLWDHDELIHMDHWGKFDLFHRFTIQSLEVRGEFSPTIPYHIGMTSSHIPTKYCTNFGDVEKSGLEGTPSTISDYPHYLKKHLEDLTRKSFKEVQLNCRKKHPSIIHLEPNDQGSKCVSIIAGCLRFAGLEKTQTTCLLERYP